MKEEDLSVNDIEHPSFRSDKSIPAYIDNLTGRVTIDLEFADVWRKGPLRFPKSYHKAVYDRAYRRDMAAGIYADIQFIPELPERKARLHVGICEADLTRDSMNETGYSLLEYTPWDVGLGEKHSQLLFRMRTLDVELLIQTVWGHLEMIETRLLSKSVSFDRHQDWTEDYWKKLELIRKIQSEGRLFTYLGEPHVSESEG